jgi:adenylate cyclase
VEGDNITIGRSVLRFIADADVQTVTDDTDQKISMVLPLSELLPLEAKETLKKDDLQFLAALTNLGKTLLTATTIQESIERVGGLISQFVKPKRLFIFFYEEKEERLELAFAQSDCDEEDPSVAISKTIAMKAIREKVAILSANTLDDARFDGAESIIMYGITSAISVPIWTKSAIYGLIYADTTITGKMFREQDLEVMSTIANFTGLSIEGINSQQTLNREKKLRARLERYHSPGVVSRILEMQDKHSREFIAYKETEASIMFMDIVGFTSRAEKMKPVEVGIFLNNIFTVMTDIIFQYNGTLDKYIGDAIMAIFGVPFAMEAHPELAIMTALEMMVRLKDINGALSEKDQVQIRVGINSGRLIAGDFGSPKRYDYTVLGNTVNIASRLESSVAGPGEIVVSQSCYEATRDLFEFEFLGDRKLQGISVPTAAYKVLKRREL